MGVRFGSFFVAGSLVFAAAPTGARAFQPETRQAPEIGHGDLARVPDAARQAALTGGFAWARFRQDHGREWRVTWDDRAGTPRSIVGGSIPLVPRSASAPEVEAAARAFLQDLRYLSGVDDSRLRTSVLEKLGDTWYVRFDRLTAAGEPVVGAYAEIRLAAGNVVLIRMETHPGAEIGLARHKLDRARAIARAHGALASFLPDARLDARARQVVAPIAVNGSWRYRPAFEVDSSVIVGAGRWRSVVDAVDGRLLARENLIRYTVEGTIQGSIEPRTVGDELVPAGLPFIRPVVGGASATADLDGFFSSGAEAPAEVDLGLIGPYIRVNNAAGSEVAAGYTAAAETGNDFVWAANDGGEQAEINAYRSASVAREWALAVTPDLGWLQQRLTVNVNIGDQCNAYWDGSTINFFDEGNFCNNTARVADVVYHEFGHGFHQNNRISGVIDGAIGEGSGDYISATITGSATLGPNFQKDGGAVRELEPNRVYPDDLVGQVHADGLIWGGAMWDLRKALIARSGEAEGRAIADGIFATVLASGPRLDQVYEEALLADDDDGDLSNGTPNQCEIEAAFGLHGLNASGAAFTLGHQEIAGPMDAGTPVAVTATRPDAAPVCAGMSIAGADLRFRIDDGPLQSSTLSLSGETFSGEIPGAPEGSVVRYWFEARFEDGNTTTTPQAAPDNVFAYYVGPTFTVFSDDFEGELAWTHGGTRDDWEAGVPAGEADPAGAYSGTRVFGNSLGGSGTYPANANNWAESPVIDCRGCRGARLQFRRWLTVEDASYDHARIFVNDEEVYANPIGEGNGGAKPQDRIWSFQDIDISEFADGRRIKIRFELSSDQGVEYGGWTIDDVTVVTPGELVPPRTGGNGDFGLFGCNLHPATTAASTTGSALLVAAGSFLTLLRRRRRI